MNGISCVLNGNQVGRLDFLTEIMFWLFLVVITIMALTLIYRFFCTVRFFEETLEAVAAVAAATAEKEVTTTRPTTEALSRIHCSTETDAANAVLDETKNPEQDNHGNQVERLDFLKEVMFWLFLNILIVITIMANLIFIFFEETLEAVAAITNDDKEVETTRPDTEAVSQINYSTDAVNAV